MKIMFLSSSLKYGGAEVQVVKLSQSLIRRGHEVLIVSLTNFDVNNSPISGKEIRHTSLGLESFVDIPKALLRFRSIVKSFSPDVVHSHMYHANILSRLLSLKQNRPLLINTSHSTNEGGGIRDILYRSTKGMIDYFSHVSQKSLDRYLSNGLADQNPGRSSVIYNGIEIKPIPNKIKHNGDFRWLAVGRLVVDKDYINLIDACKIVSQMGFKFRLDIYGGGELENELKDHLRFLGMESYVRLMGHSSNIEDVMKQYDAFVVSSRNEGLPMVMLEATLAGLPIVTTNAGGCNEALSKANQSWVCDKENPHQLSYLMINMMQASELDRTLINESNYTYISKNFDIEKLTDKWESIYKGNH